ncbi:ROK family transcriptional regulator [Desmospora activa]|uniref:Putative NBD/HSP70 family sugar kinase n=1 Tax=Desmospora activa DSM 45169 TaxID=1121389 RepID=A0A2T4ZCF3_9BACL|nr:ROK family protein [Desmospora activa]PTM59561.1 putative NBD/HSP70 family sugar kinase [Desmospora activa DSM 45169]
MITGDATYLKNLNRRIILEHIVASPGLSRAELAKITGLNKATITSQISTLLEEGLLLESGTPSHSFVGRKPIPLTLNKNAGCALGIDLDSDHANLLLTDLSGKRLQQKTVQFSDRKPETIIEELHQTIHAFSSGSIGPLVGIGLGIHGIVDHDEQVIFIPRLEWTIADVKQRLQQKHQVPVFVDNNANLSAYAERVYCYPVHNLISISAYSGIGLGMIINDQIYRGMDGFAGEVGHMIVVPQGKPCPCGNHGCWERYASDQHALLFLADTLGVDSLTWEEVKRGINRGAPIEQEMNQLLMYWVVGLNNVINIFNPEILILNSSLARVFPEFVTQIKTRLQSRMTHCRVLATSTLGKNACALGGAALAIRQFLGVERLDFMKNDPAS